MAKRVPLPGCVFCGGRPLTAEHALGKWFRTTAGLAAPARVTNYRDDALTHEKYKPSFSEKLRVACLTCNTDWMNDLEEAVLPSVTEMVRGRPGRCARPRRCCTATCRGSPGRTRAC